MYSNLGEKIKVISIVFMTLEILACLIAGLSLIGSDFSFMRTIGLVILFVGPIVCWLISVFLCGFGQLIQNSDIIATQMRRQKTTAPVMNAQEKPRYLANSKPMQTSAVIPPKQTPPPSGSFIPVAPKPNNTQNDPYNQ